MKINWDDLIFKKEDDLENILSNEENLLSFIDWNYNRSLRIPINPFAIQKFSKGFIENYLDKTKDYFIGFSHISSCQKLSKSFIEKWKDKLNFNLLKTNPNLYLFNNKEVRNKLILNKNIPRLLCFNNYFIATINIIVNITTKECFVKLKNNHKETKLFLIKDNIDNLQNWEIISIPDSVRFKYFIVSTRNLSQLNKPVFFTGSSSDRFNKL